MTARIRRSSCGRSGQPSSSGTCCSSSHPWRHDARACVLEPWEPRVGRVPTVSIGSLASVADWLDAVNRADGPRLERLTHEEIEIVGPRGTGRTDRRVLSQWLTRAGFSAESLRWFCGADGSVVVEQDARWVDATTGAERGRARVARSSSSRAPASPSTCATTTGWRRRWPRQAPATATRSPSAKRAEPLGKAEPLGPERDPSLGRSISSRPGQIGVHARREAL